MSEKEIEAIDTLKHFCTDDCCIEYRVVTPILNLIEKQQTKIKQLEADLYSANCTINEYIEERNKLKDKLKEHKKDLDYEPWSIYKIDGKVLFDLVKIMGE